MLEVDVDGANCGSMAQHCATASSGPSAPSGSFAPDDGCTRPCRRHFLDDRSRQGEVDVLDHHHQAWTPSPPCAQPRQEPAATTPCRENLNSVMPAAHRACGTSPAGERGATSSMPRLRLQDIGPAAFAVFSKLVIVHRSASTSTSTSTSTSFSSQRARLRPWRAAPAATGLPARAVQPDMIADVPIGNKTLSFISFFAGLSAHAVVGRVGTEIAPRPPHTDPDLRLSRIRLLPRFNLWRAPILRLLSESGCRRRANGKAFIKRLEPIPRHAPLTAPGQSLRSHGLAALHRRSRPSSACCVRQSVVGEIGRARPRSAIRAAWLPGCACRRLASILAKLFQLADLPLPLCLPLDVDEVSVSTCRAVHA